MAGQAAAGSSNTTVSEARPHIRPRAAMQRGEVDDGGLGGEVRRLRRAAGRRAGPRRPARAAAGLHDRPAAARRAQERRADGRPRRPGPGRGGAPVAAPLRRQGRLGRRHPAEGGAGPRAPRDAGAGAGPGLARGRHRAAEEGQALGRGGAAVLRPAREAGELPGGGDPLGRDRGGLAAGRLPALPARGLGRRPGAAGDGGGAGGGRVPDQAGDRAGPDQAGAGRRGAARGGGDRRRLRQRHRLPRRDHRAWPALRGRHPGHDRPVAARRGAAAGRARGGRGPPAEAAAPGRAAQPLAAGRLAAGLPADAWRTVTWREGTAGELASRFAAGRVRPAPGDTARPEPRPEEWFLVEWPEGEEEPTKYWPSTLSGTVPLEELVATAKLRWRIERDFEELKQELGLGHFEGRGWRGFHHHASLCVAAYAFLVAERCRFSPPGWRRRLAAPERPARYRPRGSSRAPGAAQPGLDRDPASAPGGGADAAPAPVPLLPAGLRTAASAHARQLMTP